MTDASPNIAQLPDDLSEDDVRPVVAKKQRNLSVPVFIVAAVILAVLLFTALNARRLALNAPATRVAATDINRTGSQVPQLYIPQDFAEQSAQVDLALPVEPSPPSLVQSAPLQARIQSPPVPSEPQIIYQPEPVYPDEPAAAPQRPANTGPVVIYDRSARRIEPEGAAGGDQQASRATSRRSSTRVKAGQLSNPSTTVVRGTVIPVVLETALDSTRPGQARAVVSRNVYGFTGRNILIPRGSRLVGEYDSELAAGQNRILVQWVRLLRPDGATIELDSGSADRLGRAGVRGKVNSHFLERFGNAILRTSLDVGAILATRQISNGVIVALPNSVRETAAPSGVDEVKRTLTVKHGAAISVFVARDLDFTPVERRR